MTYDIHTFAWEKMHGLLPAIVQDAKTNAILMLGYMNQSALQKTLETKWVTFFSRSKNRLWTKGEESGNKLAFIDLLPDCDKDSLLIFANPTGPVCHLGTPTCFGETNQPDWSFIQSLETLIQDRAKYLPENSYTAQLLKGNISRLAQKVGEEAVEVVLAAIDQSDKDLCNEIADLLFHILVLLQARNLHLSQVIDVLKRRSRDSK